MRRLKLVGFQRELALKPTTAQYNQAKGHFSKQIETLTNQTRDLKISEKDKMIKIDELNSKIDGLEKILNTKNDILQQTKDERDQINIQNQKREIQVDSAKIDLMTQAEQNSGAFSDWPADLVGPLISLAR